MNYQPALCRHCSRGKVDRPRGLCWNCYYTPGVKDQYPPTSKFAKFYREAGDPKKTPQPTTARPGTPEKVAVLEGRVRRGEMLYHPEDAT